MSAATVTHTPGPWKAQRAEGWRNTDIFACDKDETYICAINEDNDERAANARLIAAAPELLEALLKIVNTPTEQFYSAMQHRSWCELISSRAIAKARGFYEWRTDSNGEWPQSLLDEIAKAQGGAA